MKHISIYEICHNIFCDVHSKYFNRVNDFFAILTIISVAMIVLETVLSLQKYAHIFVMTEYITVFFFSIEYVGRIIANKKPWRYMCSFFGVIDLIAILPSFLGLGNFTFLKSARLFRMLRFLRMIRLIKLLRLQKKYNDIEKHGHDHYFSLTMQIYIITLITVVLFSATGIWILEHDSMNFSSIPHAMIWSCKVLLGGVPQVMPHTIAGDLITIITRFMGLILFSLLISIVGGSVERLLIGTAELHTRSKKMKK